MTSPVVVVRVRVIGVWVGRVRVTGEDYLVTKFQRHLLSFSCFCVLDDQLRPYHGVCGVKVRV